MQGPQRPEPRSRSRSLRPGLARVTLHRLRTQGLSRSREKHPINLWITSTAGPRSRWSAKCAYARGHEKPPELVTGVTRYRATSGLQSDEVAVRQGVHMQPLGHAPAQRG